MATEEGRSSAREGRILLGLSLLAAGLRFFQIARQSLWVDEAFSVKYAQVFGPLGADDLLDNLHGPLHALLLHLWSRTLGTSEAALRSLSALFGIATIPALHWAVRPSLGRDRALVAAALLALSPFHLWYSQEIRNYALLMFFVVLSTGAYLRASTPRQFGWLTCWNLLGFLSNLAHAFALATHGLWELLTRRRLRWLLLASWIVTALCLTPWIVRFWVHHVEPSGALALKSVEAGARLRGSTTAPLAGIPFAFFVFSVGYSLGPSLRELHQGINAALFRPHLLMLALAAAGFGITAILGVRALWREKGAARYWLLSAVLPIAFTFAVSLRNLKVFNPRYASAAFPAYIAILAAGLLAPRSMRGRVALAALILAPTTVSLAQYFTDPRYAKDDARAAAAYLKQAAKPGDYLFVVGTDEPFRRYHWREIRNIPEGIKKGDVGYWWDKKRPEQFALFEQEVSRYHEVFVIFFRADFIDPTGQWAEWIRAHHPPAEVRRFPGIEVWRFAGGAP